VKVASTSHDPILAVLPPLQIAVQLPPAKSVAMTRLQSAGLLARVQTIGFFRQRLRVIPRRFHHHQMVLVGLGSIFAAESFLKTVRLPLVEPMMMMPAESCPIEVGLESAVTLPKLAAKRRVSTAVSGLIARPTEDCHARFHQM
jgi:hypothetical protein